MDPSAFMFSFEATYGQKYDRGKDPSSWNQAWDYYLDEKFHLVIEPDIGVEKMPLYKGLRGLAENFHVVMRQQL
ncbi:hypothetical protein FRB94_009350 [Tulasnella sp. JGI-2019a]|nr:hypothetical protein FRB93_003705 [Tulasnella sp. JGI-2019a]KAG8995212.1 hypothetical protein FRB94_009350 [Tulasnella sp. JGI-2019a]